MSSVLFCDCGHRKLIHGLMEDDLHMVCGMDHCSCTGYSERDFHPAMEVPLGHRYLKPEVVEQRHGAE